VIFKISYGQSAVANIISNIVPYLSSESLTDLPEQVSKFNFLHANYILNSINLKCTIFIRSTI